MKGNLSYWLGCEALRGFFAFGIFELGASFLFLLPLKDSNSACELEYVSLVKLDCFTCFGFFVANLVLLMR